MQCSAALISAKLSLLKGLKGSLVKVVRPQHASTVLCECARAYTTCAQTVVNDRLVTQVSEQLRLPVEHLQLYRGEAILIRSQAR